MNAWQRRLDAVWLGLLALYVLAGAGQMPFHGDESTLIYMGRDYHYLLVEGDLSRLVDKPRRAAPASVEWHDLQDCLWRAGAWDGLVCPRPERTVALEARLRLECAARTDSGC